MGKLWRGRFARSAAVAALAAISVAVLSSSSPRGTSTARPVKPMVELSPIEAPLPGSDAVEMFAAMDRGDLAVRLMPERDQRARVELENRTGRPLTVRVPQAFGGRFILAAVGAGVGPPQRLGGAAGGTGLFSIPLEKVGCFHARTACLDESLPEPNPGMVYEVCRLEELTAQPAVRKLCEMLGDSHTDPQTAQAAVWHLHCGLPWPRLEARLRSCGGLQGTQRFFTRQQIEEGKRLAEVAMR